MTLGIYIQVPFCQTKCTYCNFHTGVFSSSLYAPYVSAVCRELADHLSLYRSSAIRGVGALLAAPPASPPTVDTIYLGGGTPSLLDPAALARILDAARATFPGAPEEVTLEADPETLTPDKADAWLRAGINRVSLGIQSFNDAELRAAGRMHRRADIFQAVCLLRSAGFRNVSCDLIAGLPHQTAASWTDSLDSLLGLRPEHISIYLLELDEGSRLGREVLSEGRRYGADAIPSDDEMASLYDTACARLAAEGYLHYEISNWALAATSHPGVEPEARAFIPAATEVEGTWPSTSGTDFRSRHNLKYWRREPYLGFGAGAHSFNGRERWANTHDPAAYVAAIVQGRLPLEQREEITPQAALEEELFLGLRQLEGIDLARLEKQYNVRLAPRLESLRDAGLVELDGTRLRLAPSRLAVSNEVFVALLG